LVRLCLAVGISQILSLHSNKTDEGKTKYYDNILALGRLPPKTKDQ